MAEGNVTIKMSGFAAEQMRELIRARQQELNGAEGHPHAVDCAICDAEREALQAIDAALSQPSETKEKGRDAEAGTLSSQAASALGSEPHPTSTQQGARADLTKEKGQ